MTGSLFSNQIWHYHWQSPINWCTTAQIQILCDRTVHVTWYYPQCITSQYSEPLRFPHPSYKRHQMLFAPLGYQNNLCHWPWIMVYCVPASHTRATLLQSTHPFMWAIKAVKTTHSPSFMNETKTVLTLHDSIMRRHKNEKDKILRSSTIPTGASNPGKFRRPSTLFKIWN